jgi:predicted alpha/beta hydrolase family esterase
LPKSQLNSYTKLMKHNLLLVSGFGKKGIPELGAAIQDKIDINQQQLFQGCPFWKAYQYSDSRITELQKIIQELPTEDLNILVAHSYGALIALLALCRERFKNVDHAFFIDPPINPEYELTPPPNKPLFKIFNKQYKNRKRLCQEAEVFLADNDNQEDINPQNHLLLLSPTDRIVPYKSQLINSNSPSLDYPESVIGHSLSPEKIQATVQAILRIVMH